MPGPIGCSVTNERSNEEDRGKRDLNKLTSILEETFTQRRLLKLLNT